MLSQSEIILSIILRYDVLKKVKRFVVFCIVTPYGLVGVYQCFGETYCLHLQLQKHWYLPTNPHKTINVILYMLELRRGTPKFEVTEDKEIKV